MSLSLISKELPMMDLQWCAVACVFGTANGLYNSMKAGVQVKAMTN